MWEKFKVKIDGIFFLFVFSLKPKQFEKNNFSHL